MTVDAGGYRFVFGHLSQITVNNGQEVKAGTVLGRSGEFEGDAHLHMGVINYSPYSFRNPASFFDSSVQASWLSMPYVVGESMLSMKGFSMENVKGYWDRFYWGDCPDRTGIER